MIRRPLAVCLALSLFAVAGSGCAGFRSGSVPETSPWPPAGGAKGKSVSLSVSGGMNINKKPGDPPPAALTRWRDLTHQTYMESQLFTTVLSEGSPADVRAEVRITNDGEASQAMAFVTGLTLFLLPSRATDRFTMRTDFKNARGNVLASIEKSDSVSTWMQLFLVFAMPFKSPGPVVEDMLCDLSRATLADARAKGVL